ncbi:MAG: riboflavin kinase [Ilumatobacteraceae bacterium]
MAANAVLTPSSSAEEIVIDVDVDDRQQWEQLRGCGDLGVSILTDRPTTPAMEASVSWAADDRGAVLLDGARAWLRCDGVSALGPARARLRVRSASTETAVTPLLFHSPLAASAGRRRGPARVTSTAERRSVICGVVEAGDQRGRTIGFPTANLPIIDGLVSHGVWAGWLVRQDDTVLPAAISVGRRSTFYGERGHVLLEAHVIDFDGDLYGETVTVHLGAHLREQRTFDGVDSLIGQLRRDVEVAAAWCARTDAWRHDGRAS